MFSLQNMLGGGSSEKKSEIKSDNNSLREEIMKTTKIKWLKTTSNLAQIYSRGFEFCFISKNNEQVCPFVLCKDFLHDAIMGIHNNKKVQIYGFKYDPSKDLPVCLDKSKIAIANSQDDNFKNKIPKILGILNQVESELRLKKTKALEISNPPKMYKKCGIFLLEGSNRWLISPPMVSLYTLLIRCGVYHNVKNSWRRTLKDISDQKPQFRDSSEGKFIPPSGNAGCNDYYYLSKAQNAIDFIIQNGYAKIFYKDPKKNYPDVSINSMHGEFGIVGFSNKATERHIKYWHRDLTKKPKSKKSKKKESLSKKKPTATI